MKSELRATKRTYCGLFLVGLATLMYEILLTRIFSVTLWYHYAFMAVSIAMFGMTVGAMQVYLSPKYFAPEKVKHELGRNCLFFSLTIVLGSLLHLSIPSAIYRTAFGPISIAITYALISIPFGFSGICGCLALTKFPKQVSKLYAFDLAGAALGCILLFYTLRFTDGPNATIVVAFLASIGAIFFLEEEESRKLKRLASGLSLSLLVLASVNGIYVARQSPLLRLKWAKGSVEDRPLYEKWNSFSRVQVRPDPETHPFGWGLSPELPPDRRARQLFMDIDANALTILTAYDGVPGKLDYLKYDVANVVYHFRPRADVLALGAGGGRDILTALVFGAKSVVAVEINENIIDAVNHRFGDFTGHLDRLPNVTFVNDEARSYVARSKSRFDIIQISLIDTWAATAAGAFVLSENSLYTVEAWKSFLRHLTPRGILSMSRWYSLNRPAEVYRSVSLARTSLEELGVQNPGKHIIVVRCLLKHHLEGGPEGVGTILVSREPFSEQDLTALEAVSRRMQFDVVLSPRFSLDSTFATLAGGQNLENFLAHYPLNIAAPTDDNPFFFHMLRLRNAYDPEQWKPKGNANLQAVGVLVTLLIAVLGLTFYFVFLRLLHKTRRRALEGAVPLLIFFGAIGLGYMLIEISQMERLMIFLGHPAYGLSVVLFSLLLSSGLGSRWTERLGNPPARRQAVMYLLLLIFLLVLFGKFTPLVTRAFEASETAVRLGVAVAILFPIGFVMGMPFPLGMKAASRDLLPITPWLWAVNGANSVVASVLAIVIAIGAGVSASFWTGFVCYVVSFLAFLYATKRM